MEARSDVIGWKRTDAFEGQLEDFAGRIDVDDLSEEGDETRCEVVGEKAKATGNHGDKGYGLEIKQTVLFGDKGLKESIQELYCVVDDRSD